uniref:Uncharacterized protein n=1 Tax=Pundamilia nyererei TaxID=303518 RepID=A0A3B4FBW9_9CICH
IGGSSFLIPLISLGHYPRIVVIARFQPFMASALEVPTLFTTSSSTKKQRPDTVCTFITIPVTKSSLTLLATKPTRCPR